MMELLPEELSAKKAQLEDALRSLGSVLVAYSGGIDSAYLAFAAHRVLNDRMLAVIADSASLARSHYREALEFAQQQAIPVKTIATSELSHEAYAVNDSNRCFHCKDELFTVLEAERVRLGFAAVAYGLNVDDKKDFRPGQRAAANHQVSAPLAAAGLTKADVRALARAAGLPIWDKPASACLSSRIEYGRRVTPENLRMVEQAEDALRELGLRKFRVRHHGTMARIEIAEDELPHALNTAFFRRMSSAVRAAGFQYVAVDCEGYRSGSMNEILPVDTLIQGMQNDLRSPNMTQLLMERKKDVESTDQVMVLECSIDDASPQVLAHTMELALEHGALDAMSAPVTMKKGRLGTLLTVLTRPEDASKIEELLFRETTTIGIRRRLEERVILERNTLIVDTEFGKIRVKTASRNGVQQNAMPEYEDCRSAAHTFGVPLKRVMEATLAALTDRVGT